MRSYYLLFYCKVVIVALIRRKTTAPFYTPVIPLKEALRHTQGDKTVIVAQVEERKFYNLKRGGGGTEGGE